MPRSLPAYQQLSQIYLQNGDPKGALAVLDEAAKQQGSDARFLITLAELYAGYGQLRKTDPEGLKQRVIETLNRAAKLELDDPSLLEKLADGYKLMGENQKALEMYTRLLEEEPDLPNLRVKLFEAYLTADDKKRAAEQLEAIIRDTPTNSRAYYFLGVLAQEEDNYAKAEDFLKKAVLLSPENEQFHYELARLQINMRKPKEALETLEKVRTRFKQNFVHEFYSGLAFSVLKRYGEAINHYTAAEVIVEATDPKPSNLHVFYYQLGAAYERKRDYAQAEKYFERCLELSPKFDEALNYYGYMSAERGVNLEKARKMIEQAVEAEPKNAAYLDSLGWVLYKLKQPDEALKYLLQAIEQSDEPDPTLFDHLADVYAELKEEEKARQNWQKAVDYLRKEIAKHEDDPDADSFEQLGDIYAKLNQIEQAQEAWRKSLAIEPNESVQKKLETHSSNNSSAP
jgi:tetratricopeptide (TPR) repeat protein